MSLRRIRFATGASAMSPTLINLAVGEPLGFYADEGLSVTIDFLGSNEAMLEAARSRRADFSVGTATFQLPLVAAGRDLPAINYYEYAYPFKYDLAVLPSSAPREVADLRGMRIGVTSFQAIDYPVAKRMCRAAGLDPDGEVRWLPVGHGLAAGRALMAGSVDALMYFDAEFSRIEEGGIELRYLPRPNELPRVGGIFLAVRPDALQADRAAAVGFARGVAKGTLFCLGNPAAAADVLLRTHPTLGAAGSSPAVQIERIMRAFAKRSRIWRSSDPSLRWGEIDRQEWASEVEVAGLSGRVDPTRCFTNELIDEINDFDEEAVRERARALPTAPPTRPVPDPA